MCESSEDHRPQWHIGILFTWTPFKANIGGRVVLSDRTLCMVGRRVDGQVAGDTIEIRLPETTTSGSGNQIRGGGRASASVRGAATADCGSNAGGGTV